MRFIANLVVIIVAGLLLAFGVGYLVGVRSRRHCEGLRTHRIGMLLVPLRWLKGLGRNVLCFAGRRKLAEIVRTNEPQDDPHGQWEAPPSGVMHDGRCGDTSHRESQVRIRQPLERS
jgi:hypothetical protein